MVASDTCRCSLGTSKVDESRRVAFSARLLQAMAKGLIFANTQPGRIAKLRWLCASGSWRC